MNYWEVGIIAAVSLAAIYVMVESLRELFGRKR